MTRLQKEAIKSCAVLLLPLVLGAAIWRYGMPALRVAEYAWLALAPLAVAILVIQVVCHLRRGKKPELNALEEPILYQFWVFILIPTLAAALIVPATTGATPVWWRPWAGGVTLAATMVLTIMLLILRGRPTVFLVPFATYPEEGVLDERENRVLNHAFAVAVKFSVALGMTLMLALARLCKERDVVRVCTTSVVGVLLMGMAVYGLAFMTVVLWMEWRETR